MKILILTHYFPPEGGAGSIRMDELAHNLRLLGHQIFVVTNFPNYQKNKIYDGFKNTFLKTSIKGNFTIIRVFTFLGNNNNLIYRGISQIISMLMFIIGAFRIKRPDVIIATSPPFTIGICALILKLFKRAPLFFDVRDPYPVAPIELGIVKNNYLIKLLYLYEKFVYKVSTRVITVTEGFRYLVAKSGCLPSKIDIVPNGVNTDFFQKVDNRKSILNKFNLEDKFTVIYTGTLGRVHDLGILVETARALSSFPSIQFVIVGSGYRKNEILRLINKYKLDNIFLFSPMPKNDIKLFLSAADIGFQALSQINYIKFAHAIKIFEYMSMKLPVIFVGEGECDKLIKDAQSGITCSRDNLEEIVNAILLLQSDPVLRNRLGLNGRQYVQKYFNRSILSFKYNKIISDAYHNKN